MNNINTFEVGKWKIELNSLVTKENKTYYYVKVDNKNAKKAWTATKYHYNFGESRKRAEDWIISFTSNQKDWEATKLKRREERKKKDRSSEETVIVKRALVEKYGYKNVRVVRGRGTACGWVEARVKIDEPMPSCDMCKDSSYGRCYKCSEKWRNDRSEAKNIAYDALKKAGLKFGTWYGDDDYAKDEFLLDIDYLK